MIKQLVCVVVVVGSGCAGLADPPERGPAPAPNGVDVPGAPSAPTPSVPSSPSGPTDPTSPSGGPVVASGTWTPLASVPFSQAGFQILLTDGTVLVQELLTGTWRRLTPDIDGSYLHGTWSTIAAMPAGYGPLYFGAGVLPDGRVMIEGGEYNLGPAVWTTLGAVYDPVSNAWTSVAPPAGWTSIGDASAMVLADGTYMQSDCCSTKSALLNPATMTWTATGTGKQGASNDEESWTLLQDGTVLTVDCNNTVNLLATEIYTPSTGKWTLGANTANKTCDINPDGSGSHENGPAILRYDGTVFAVGGTGHNDIYTVATKTWKAAADSPIIGGQLDSADGPAVLLPNGNMLIVLSPGVFQAPSHMFEWDGSTLTEVTAPPGAASNPSYVNNFLLLPTGEVLLTDFSNDIELFTPTNRTPVAGVAPTITSIPALVTSVAPDAATDALVAASPVPAANTPLAVTTLHPGTTYRISAQRMNGLSEAVAYGDDAHGASNYPIVRIKNTATGHVFYCRTFGHSNRAIGPSTTGMTSFTVPAGVAKGAATLELVANGIASPAISINVK
jgi:hypothetical protein